MKAFVVALLGLAFIGIFAYVVWEPVRQAIVPKGPIVLPTDSVVDFATCVEAGGVITEGDPRTCKVESGIVYTERATSTNPNGCRDDLSCGRGKFCNQGVCQAIEYATTCSEDSDCQLVNEFVGWGCCYAGQCDPIDYSQDNWIAVNYSNYQNQQKKYCPAIDQCGPMPGCPSSIKPSNFVAVCQLGTCIKREGITPVPKVPDTE